MTFLRHTASTRSSFAVVCAIAAPYAHISTHHGVHPLSLATYRSASNKKKIHQQQVTWVHMKWILLLLLLLADKYLLADRSVGGPHPRQPEITRILHEVLLQLGDLHSELHWPTHRNADKRGHEIGRPVSRLHEDNLTRIVIKWSWCTKRCSLLLSDIRMRLLPGEVGRTEVTTSLRGPVTYFTCYSCEESDQRCRRFDRFNLNGDADEK